MPCEKSVKHSNECAITADPIKIEIYDVEHGNMKSSSYTL